jgi:DNA-binding GntR family transcriptional regulator
MSRQQQLTETLLGQIVDGTMKIGDRVPTEAELCASYGLARGTVRRALEQVERLGMIDRRPGVGTTVLADRPVGPYQPVAQGPADIATLAADTRILRPESAEIVADATLARRIGARAGTTWFVLRGVRVRRGEALTPLCWSEQYLRADLPREKLVRASFSVEDVAAYAVTQTISASLLGPEVAVALAAEPGAAALVITRRHRHTSGRLVSAGIHTHPADRFEITTTL